MNKTELKTKWAEVIELLSENTDPVIIETFFNPLVPSKISDSENLIFLAAPYNSSFFQNTVKNNQNYIIDATSKVFGKSFMATVVDTDMLEEDEKDEQQKEDSLNPKYTFSSFVQGPTNRMACAASMAIADGFSKKYNPLFIYAGSGLGKTHLMHAIGHFVKQHKPKKKILYVSAETFTSELIEAIRTKKQQQFKDKYRKVDYLLFDDVQFIKNQAVEDELFNTFEALYNNGKQMVFTSDCPPKDLGDIPDRLRSRFVWGMMVDIQPPDYETRMAILKNKALLENIPVDNRDIIEVFDLIAQNVKSNIRELEGAFTRVVAISALSGDPITPSLAKKVLFDIITEPEKNITPELIKKKVAEYYGLKVSDLDSSKRSREIAFPRHIAIYLIRNELDLSYPNIAKIFNKKDHTSIMHSCDVIEQQIKNDPDFLSTLNAIINNIKG